MPRAGSGRAGAVEVSASLLARKDCNDTEVDDQPRKSAIRGLGLSRQLTSDFGCKELPPRNRSAQSLKNPSLLPTFGISAGEWGAPHTILLVTKGSGETDDMKTVHQLLLTDAYAAEAQRVVIAENLALRLIYQAWWVRWTSRAIILGGIAFCLAYGLRSDAALFAGLLILTFVAEYWGLRSNARIRRMGRAKGTTTTVSMDESGIDIVGAFSSSRLKWEGLRYQPAVRSDGVLLKIAKTRGVWLPDRTLTEGTPSEVRQLVSSGFKGGWDDDPV